MCVLFGGIFRFLTDFLHWHLSQRKALVQELNAATSTYVDGATHACMHICPPFMRVRWWTYYHAHAPTHYHDCAYEYVHSRCLSLLGLCVCVCVCVCAELVQRNEAARLRSQNDSAVLATKLKVPIIAAHHLDRRNQFSRSPNTFTMKRGFNRARLRVYMHLHQRVCS